MACAIGSDLEKRQPGAQAAFFGFGIDHENSLLIAGKVLLPGHGNMVFVSGDEFQCVQ